MPQRPPSHSALEQKRLGRGMSDLAYEQQVRAGDAGLHEAARLRHTKRFRRLRLIVLARDPLCRDPYGNHEASGRVALAEQVDHVVPLCERPDLAYDLENLQGLCVRCHQLKTRRGA